MRIGIDVSPALSPHGGVSNYVCHLLEALLELRSLDEFVAYTPNGTRGFDIWKKWEPFPNLQWGKIRTFSFGRPTAIDFLDLYHGTNF